MGARRPGPTGDQAAVEERSGPRPGRRNAVHGRPEELGDRLRQARTDQGLSLRELAGRIGVSASLISQIETGKAQPSVNTLYALAVELGLSVDELLFENRARTGEQAPERRDASGSPVQRAGDRKAIELDTGVRWERLTTTSVPGIDFLYVVYEPGGESTPDDALHRHSGREWGFVMRGTLHVVVGFDEYVLGAGDSISFDSTVPHRLYNPGPEEVRGVWFVLGRQGGAPALGED